MTINWPVHAFLFKSSSISFTPVSIIYGWCVKDILGMYGQLEAFLNFKSRVTMPTEEICEP